MSTVRAYLLTDEPHSRLQSRLGQSYRRWLAFRSNPLAMVGLAIVVGLLLVAAFAPLIATHDPLAQNLANRLRPPSSAHLFGTDALGRDIFSRIVYGARASLLAGLISVAIALGIGVPRGLVAG